MDGNDVKITTGEGLPADGRGAGPEVAPVPSPAPAPAPSQPFGGAQGQPDFLAPENLGPSPMPAGVEQSSGGTFRTILLILAGLIFVGGVGALGYFVVYPLLFPPRIPSNKPPITNNLPAAIPHTSFLTQAPAATSNVTIADVSYPAIASALQTEAFNQLADGQYKEVKISNNAGQIPFPQYLGGVSPAMQALALGDWFENDFTALFYYDAAGVWPIYVAKLKPGATREAVMAGMRSAEGVMDLANFYLSSPGAFGGFKDGKVGSYTTRYSVASAAGAALNYGVAGNYLIISANYNGLKNILPALGL